MGKLTANEVKAALATPGSYQDGDGLFLKVSKGKGASWVVRIQHEGKRRDYYLGAARLLTLAEARAKAAEHRKAVRIDGRDLAEEKRREKAAAVTFREAAKTLYEAHKSKWHQPKHAAQWLSTLETYAFPSLGERPVGEIEARHIIAAISKVWSEKPETGRRVRQRICAVLDYAHARGWRDSEAPARSLQAGKGLPRQPARNTHRLAMPYGELPAFLRSLSQRFSFGRLALQFTILTAARSGEVRGAVWNEIDLDAAFWTIPADRMKARREHVVPLSAPALAVLEKAKAMRVAGNELVLPGMQSGKAMSDMTLLKVLRDAGEPYHVHGFRSSFRDWVSEETNFPGDVAEAALAHLVANKVEAAYRRGNLLEKRRRMMDAWGAFCEGGKGAKVVPLRKQAGT